MKRRNFNDATLTVRLPQALLDQFTVISDAQFKPASQLVRELIVDYVRNNQTVLTMTQPTPVKPKPTSTRPSYQQEQLYFPNLKDPNLADIGLSDDDDWD